MTPKRTTTLLQNTALLTAGLIVALAIAEVALRAAGVYASYTEQIGAGSYVSPFWATETGWYHLYQPGSSKTIHTTEFDHTVHCNQLGIDDIEWPLQKQKPLRIACLGDSFTEGVGAPADSSYARQLENMMDSATVMKCGINGNDPFFAYMLLKDKLAAYRPDIVTISINSTDIYETVIRGGFNRFGSDSNTHYTKRPPGWEPLYAQSYLVRLLVHKVLGYNRFLYTAAQWQAESQQAIDSLKQCIDKTQAWCHSNNIRCVFVFNPMLYEMQQGHMDCQPLLTHAAAQGYEVVNVQQYFIQHGLTPQNIYTGYWPKDTHNNSRGYTLFAQAVKQQLQVGLYKTKIPAGEQGF